MSLIKCPDCQKPISENAASCPGCGFVLTPDVIEQQKEKQKKEGGNIVIAAIFAFFVILIPVLLGLSAKPSNFNYAEYQKIQRVNAEQAEIEAEIHRQNIEAAARGLR